VAARRKRMIVYYKALLRGMASRFNVNLETPFKDLPEDFARNCCTGTWRRRGRIQLLGAGKMSKVMKPFEGVLPNMGRLYTRRVKVSSRAPAQGVHESPILRRLQRPAG